MLITVYLVVAIAGMIIAWCALLLYLNGRYVSPAVKRWAARATLQGCDDPEVLLAVLQLSPYEPLRTEALRRYLNLTSQDT